MPNRGQLSLFEAPAPRATAAAEEHNPATRDAVEAWMRVRGAAGATRDEVAENLDLPLQSVCPIFLVLAREGLITRAGKTRPTRCGRPAQVFVAAGHAVDRGDLIPRALPGKPARGSTLARSAAENTARLRREAAAERIMLAGRRARKSDEEIREQLAAEGLAWPQ